VYDYRYRYVGVLLAVGFHTVIFLLVCVERGGIMRVGAIEEAVIERRPTPPRWPKVAGRRSMF
jgi:hypothetical protein